MSVPEEPFPPYSYVPGGAWPHPVSDARGHWARAPLARPAPIVAGHWGESDAYLRGAALFNAGYYWEAHEVWEGLWHAHGRRGPVAQLLRALIKLAAAGVKVREGQAHGVITHARRAAEILETLRSEVGQRCMGVDLKALARHAKAIAAQPPADAGPPGVAVVRVFGFAIEPS